VIIRSGSPPVWASIEVIRNQWSGGVQLSMFMSLSLN